MMRKAKLKEMITSAMRSNGEQEEDIEVIHIGAADGSGYDGTMADFGDREDAYVADSLDELNYAGDPGFGGQEFHAFHIYTQNNIYLKKVYDGSECVVSVPRHPDRRNKPDPVGA